MTMMIDRPVHAAAAAAADVAASFPSMVPTESSLMMMMKIVNWSKVSSWRESSSSHSLLTSTVPDTDY